MLAVQGVTLQYRTNDRSARNHLVTATYRVTFNVQESDRYVVLGPSGCGKSTLLKAVGGFIRPVEGQISLDGAPIKAPGPDRVFVFQEFDQLLPWKTVKENIVFALTASGKARCPEAEERAMHNIQKVKLTEFAASYPHTLSGGMKQRAAIARALAMEPRILLMDEPFAALDEITRLKLNDDLAELQASLDATVVFVTHSVFESVYLADRIVVMAARPGRAFAEIAVDAPKVRREGFRLTASYAETCRRTSEALHLAMGEAPPDELCQ